LPFKNENFTIVVARWVVEHLENPERALQECARVLRKGGLLFVTTPNLLNYTMLIAKITPLWFHNCVTRKTGGRQDAPKYYRANTKKRLTQLAVENGFTVKYFSCDPGSFLYYAFNRYLFFGMKKISTMVSRVTSRFHLRMICLMQKRDGV
jgi:SAM-dependent methyltransferase